MKSEYLTAREVARLLRVSYSTLLRLVGRGVLQPVPGLRVKRFARADINALAKGGQGVIL